MPLVGIGKQNLLQAKLKVEPLVQNAHPEENPNDVHMNINGVDPSVVGESIGGEETSTLYLCGFITSFGYIRRGCELRARGMEGNADLRNTSSKRRMREALQKA